MSGLEALAVIGCIAAVCSAYVDGSELVHNLRVRRAQKKALQAASKEDGQAESLEMSLTRGNTRVRSRYDQNFERLGERYARGDDVARDQLKDIIIHLQSAVIMNLKYAWRQDTMVDFQSLEDTSEESQMRATLCLIDLNKRMLVAAPITEMPLPIAQRENFGLPDRSVPIPQRETFSTMDRSGPITQREIYSIPDRSVQTQRVITMPAERDTVYKEPAQLPKTVEVPWEQPGSLKHIQSISQQATEPGSKKDKKRGFSLSSWGRNKSVGTAAATAEVPSQPTRREPSPKPIPRPPNPRNPSTTDSTQTDSIDYNPWSEEASSIPTTPPTITTTRPPPTTSASAPPAIITPPRSHRTSFASSITPSIIPPSVRQLTTIPTNDTTSSSSSLLPSYSNAYRGLCKSAWRLQTSQPHSKALSAKSMPASAYSLTKRYWGCTECAFRGTLVKDPTTGKDAFDTKLYRSRDGRVKFRWLFLFRSHVKVKEREADRFSCVFCCAEPAASGSGSGAGIGSGTAYTDTLPLAIGPLEVFANVEGLLSHISREHTGEGRWPEGRVLWHMNCAVEGGGGVREGWDVLLCEGDG